MTLKVNTLYPVEDGFIVPLCRLKKAGNETYAIFKKIEDGAKQYAVHHVTYNTVQLREIFGLKKKEKVEIV